MLSNTAPAPAQAVTQWSQFLGNSAHTSYAADPALTSGGASTLGVKWMANLYSTDLGSPVVAYNSTLNKEVVYVGDERGDVFAVDASTGQEIWSTNLSYGAAVRATPAIAPDGSVWVGSNFDATLYKLDGATGQVDCSAKSLNGLPIEASPMIASLPGGGTNVYWASIDGNVSGPIVGTVESDCSQVFAFYDYRISPSGPWATPAYAVSATGEPLVYSGTADPDSTEYAVDANTGSRAWYFQTDNPAPSSYDIGDGATVSSPGVNGFADGVLYVNNKYGIEYALDLTTGAKIWQYAITPASSGYTISSTALDGNQIVYGYAKGVISLNATTGAKLWNYGTPAEVASSPAIVGPSGSEIVAFSDLTGAFRVVSLASGTPLYKYQTGGYITSSPAEYDGIIYTASSDGFLYAFTEGGANGSLPTTGVSSPTSNQVLPNPNGSLTVTGASSDSSSVAAVEIAIQANGHSAMWYDAATTSWNSAPVRNSATLASPGAATTNWSFSFPVPAAGGTYTVFANTVNGGHLVDHGTSVSFTVSPSANEPLVQASASFSVPGSSFTARASGFTPGETVTFSILGATVGSAKAGKLGKTPKVTVHVPTTASFGPTSLSATGGTSGKTSTTTIYISNAWTQFGYSALRESWEPDDTVISHTIDVGGNTILAKSWVYSSGAPINTQPAVVAGVAYFGNDAGMLTAVSTQSGSELWKYTIPSGAAIRSSPAVDGSGNIIFGANDGNLYILSSSGALVKTIALGGDLGPPALDGGSIIVASSNGNIYSIADFSWTTTWTENTGAAVNAPVASDSANGVVIVANSAGAVTAYNFTTGATVWTANAGGAVAGAPAIYNGKVYVGSADSSLYAYNETTGALQWSYATDGPITSGATLAGWAASSSISFIAVGSSTGSVYQLSFAGALMSRQTAKAAVVGLSAVARTLFAATNAGILDSIRVAWSPWNYHSAGSLSVAPAILNGTVYLGAGDGNLYAFSPNGATPMDAVRAGGAMITVNGGWACSAQP
jgi:outer membrane protein assembly factor BamB